MYELIETLFLIFLWKYSEKSTQLDDKTKWKLIV